MKKGDRVKIYEDPFTCKKLEGTAKLLTRLQINKTFEVWTVLFDDDDWEMTRTIKKEESND